MSESTDINNKFIENSLIQLFANIGMDAPSNLDAIVEFVSHDIVESADPDDWHDGDVVIAFRRWIESRSLS